MMTRGSLDASEESSSGSRRPTSGSSTRAPKGAACLNCRRRKMKCDCTRPVCGQCVRFGRERDCEYTDGDQRSRTEILEETITNLQTRLRAYENTGDSILRRSPPTNPPADMFFDSSSGRASPESNSQLSIGVAQNLIDMFLPHASDLGFFLNVPRFLERVTFLFSTGSSPSRAPPDALLSAIYVWGMYFSGNSHFRSNEAACLTRAQQQVAAALSTPHANGMHILQAEILLANYLFNSGRFLEGRAHLGSAIALALCYRLQKIRSPSDFSLRGPLRLVNTSSLLGEPMDLVDEGERIHGFWVLYSMDKVWSIALGRGSMLVEDGSPISRIETPWPLTKEQYQEGNIPDGYIASQTIDNFINDTTSTQLFSDLPSTVLSALALRAQSAALLDRSAWLSSICSSDPSSSVQHQTAFNALDNRIEQFILSLPTIASLPDYPIEIIKSLGKTHMIARLAVIRLHMGFSDHNITSAAKCLSASKAIIAIFKAMTSGYGDQLIVHNSDPILPILLTSSAQIMIIELSKAKHGQALWQTGPACSKVSYMSEVAHEFVGMMGSANKGSILTGMQVSKVESARAMAGV
ncbi:hypothetical protein C8Q75DRAFT_788457 [Abortiporus biennis]|nr:hypothetical protein C8Q75DRAFT_788457 [Abortiporus biennis]